MGSYNPNIPVITDPMLKSQAQIRANFQAINTTFVQNHAKLNAPNQGQHTVTVFREQTVDPTTSATQIALFTRAVTGVTQLFFRPNSNQARIQLTFDSIQTGIQTVGPPEVYYPQQYTFMAGPFVVYGGLITGATNGQVVNLTPNKTIRYVGLMLQTPNPGLGGINLRVAPTSVAGNSFTISYAAGLSIQSQNVYYFAVGS